MIMIETWLKTKNRQESEEFSSDFWSRHAKAIESGEFWADRIKSLKGDPAKRLKLALNNLPLPASFRESAIALRGLVKEKRNDNQNYEDELALLYWLAALNSFSVPYSELLQEPGYNIIESIPAKILKELPFTYHELGYEHLDLLNKTDIKWIVEKWGSPKNHSTLHMMHINVWSEYEIKLKTKRLKR